MEKLTEKLRGFWDTSDLYKMEKRMMRVFSMWPGDELINWRLIGFYVLGLLVVTVPEIIFLCRTNFEASYFDYAQCLIEFFYITQFNFSFLIFLYKRREIKVLLTRFQSAWDSAMSENSRELQEFHDHVMKIACVFISFAIGISVLATFNYSIGPFAYECFRYFVYHVEDIEWPLVIKVDYGYDVRSNTIVFILYSILSRIHFFFYCLFTLILEPFMILRFIWIGKFFDIVRIKIKLLQKHWTTMGPTDDEKYEKLVSIVKLYDTGLGFANDLEGIVCYIMLMKFILISFVLCFCLFNFSLINNEWFPFVVMATCVVTTQFILFAYSYLGSYLTEKCELVGFDAYQLDWPGHTKKSQIAIKFIIFRSQIPQVVTSGKFNDISLSNFCTILQTSFSYYTLLQSVFE